MIEEKINNFLNAPSDSINLGDLNNINIKENIKIFWGEENIGQLTRGSSTSAPIAEAINTEYLSSENKLLVSAKLQKWIDDLIKTKLWPISENIKDKLSSNIRAIQFNLFEALGTLPIEKFKSFLKDISPEEKNALSKLGIRIGAKYFFVPNFLKKASMELLAVLWCVFNDYKFDGFLPLPKDGRVSFESDNEMQKGYWFAIGYLKLNNFALRIDVFERIFFIARQKIKSGPFLDSADLMNPVGCNRNQLKDILTYCGLSYVKFPNERYLFFYESNKVISKPKRVVSKKIDLKLKSKNRKISKKIEKSIDPNSPFAVLEKLL
jgi:ATP-dependent RNA helicase SUPV3L1/SUV3